MGRRNIRNGLSNFRLPSSSPPSSLLLDVAQKRLTTASQDRASGRCFGHKVAGVETRERTPRETRAGAHRHPRRRNAPWAASHRHHLCHDPTRLRTPHTSITHPVGAERADRQVWESAAETHQEEHPPRRQDRADRNGGRAHSPSHGALRAPRGSKSRDSAAWARGVEEFEQGGADKQVREDDGGKEYSVDHLANGGTGG
ncbi:hypothetical protein C8J57DRAFT_1637706 [Mycena rebaudengoi]|nr:hypothetical protein C8J57DRAFT_1637706 [Mycena rebaudengoi]